MKIIDNIVNTILGILLPLFVFAAFAGLFFSIYHF